MHGDYEELRVELERLRTAAELSTYGVWDWGIDLGDRTPVLLISGNPPEAHARAAGATYLTKPVLTHELLEAIASVLAEGSGP